MCQSSAGDCWRAFSTLPDLKGVKISPSGVIEFVRNIVNVCLYVAEYKKNEFLQGFVFGAPVSSETTHAKKCRKRQ